MIKVQKNIPIPIKKGRPAKYPFSSMSVGDSFEVNGAPKNTVLNSAISWCSRHNKKAKFSIRFEDGKTRIWRIK